MNHAVTLCSRSSNLAENESEHEFEFRPNLMQQCGAAAEEARGKRLYLAYYEESFNQSLNLSLALSAHLLRHKRESKKYRRSKWQEYHILIVKLSYTFMLTPVLFFYEALRGPSLVFLFIIVDILFSLLTKSGLEAMNGMMLML